MNRQVGLISALAVVLLLVAFYFLAWAPKSEEIATIEEDIEDVLRQQATTQQRIRALEEVRQRAPQIEADITTAEAIVPADVAFPATLRQLQLSADDAGVRLVSIAPGRPLAVAEGADLATITLGVVVEGSYFQLIDFFRRIEEPAITPRGIVWEAVSLAEAEYPVLSASAQGRMFALLPAPAAAAPAQPQPTPTPTPTDDEGE